MLKNAMEIFHEFKNCKDTLWIYKEQECIFKSDKDVLGPLIEYIQSAVVTGDQILIMDKVMGNAAALLSIKAGATQIYSPLGSELASKTLSKYKVNWYIEQLVPFILARNGRDMCPMEKLSLIHTPDKFYEVLKSKFNPSSNIVDKAL
ncbi:MAG: DUF1893 domain-containing protein [Methyloversatilis sp.]|jgi:hypothetical protein|nr:DUF1893 domain-containing protein [Methyloversatilis sp.]